MNLLSLARALVEDRIGGKESATNPFDVRIHNDLIEFTSKTNKC